MPVSATDAKPSAYPATGRPAGTGDRATRETDPSARKPYILRPTRSGAYSASKASMSAALTFCPTIFCTVP